MKTLVKKESIGKRFNQVIYKLAQKSVKEIDYEKFSSLYKNKQSHNKVFLVQTEKFNVNFFYLSQFVNKEIEFFFIKPKDRQRVVQQIKDKSVQAIITPQENSLVKRLLYMGKHS